MKENVLKRVEKLRAAMAAAGADAFVALNDEDSNWESLFYLSGFRGTAGAVVVTKNSAELLLDSRYTEQGSSQSPHEIVSQKEGLDRDVLKILARHNAGVVLCEAGKTSHTMWQKLAADGRISWRDGTELAKKLRRTKDAEEVECIRKSARIASDAFMSALDEFRPSMTEKQFEAALNYKISLAGGEPGFDMIVASGVRSSMPHGRATDKPIAAGEWVTVDYGARWNGYFCDITRNFQASRAEDRAVELHELLERTHKAAASLLKPGACGADVHNAAVAVLEEAGMGKYFTHSLGHGFGLEIHEAPLLSARRNYVLAAGDVVTIEPGVYIEGWGGLRLEDDYLVTETGAQRLTDMLNQCFYRA